MTTFTDAIEPSDAGYFAQLDREHAQEEAQEEFIRPLANTLDKPRPFLNRIPVNRCAEIFDEALQAIYSDENKATVFNQALLSVWVDSNTALALQKIRAMIEEHIHLIAKKEFEKNPRLFDRSSKGASVAAHNGSANPEPKRHKVMRWSQKRPTASAAASPSAKRRRRFRQWAGNWPDADSGCAGIPSANTPRSSAAEFPPPPMAHQRNRGKSNERDDATD